MAGRLCAWLWAAETIATSCFWCLHFLGYHLGVIAYSKKLFTKALAKKKMKYIVMKITIRGSLKTKLNFLTR